MKKMILTALAALLVAVPAAEAQKVNKGALVQKIEKCVNDSADAKKGVKAATWINLGKAYYEAAIAPTKDIYVGMPEVMVKLALGGEPSAVAAETLVGVEYTAWTYPYLVVYLKDAKLAAWKQTAWVVEDAPRKALAAYEKAYEIDPKSASKVQEGLKSLSDFCSQVGNVGIDTGNYGEASASYETAFDAQSLPAFGSEPSPELLYFAGYLCTVDGAEHPESFVKGADYLTRALDLGYADEEGNIYYYLFHCFYGQREADKANLMKGKDALLTGIAKFPKNERILDGLMQLYTAEEGVGDPADLVTMIDQAIAENPESVDLWFGRGRIFYALKNYDEAIASFEKVAQLKPDLYEGQYFTGLFYIYKAEEENKALNANPPTSQAGYDAVLKHVNDIYRQAIPWLEKAYELKPSDINSLDLLKQLCFRLRDEEGMTEKYNQYNELFKQMKGE